MLPIYATSLPSAVLDSGGEVFKCCAEGDLKKLEDRLLANENIYKPAEYFGAKFHPLFAALWGKNEKLVNRLLDIYDIDLEGVAQNSKRLLLALPEDQTEEFWKTVENAASQGSLPVLVKNEKNENLKRVFLRQQLENKDDLSFELAKQLETKNGVCDLNWRSMKDAPEDTFLHIAVHNGMKSVVQRLLVNPMVDVKNVNCRNQNILHYACATSLEMVKLLLPTTSFESLHTDPSYLYQAARSGRTKTVNFIINLMMEHGKHLNEILKIPFEFVKSTEEELLHDHMFHLIAKSGNFEFFLENIERYSEEDFCIQNSEGETILHILVTSYGHKLNYKIKLLSRIASQHPKLLMIKDNNHRLPLHLAAFCDVSGQKLFKQTLKLTIETSANPEIFFEDLEVAVETMEIAIDMNKGLSEEYLSNFLRILSSHGERLLQKTVLCDKSLKSLKGILSSPVKINPNKFHDGTNSFLALLQHNAERLYSTKPGQETFMRFQMLTNYHAVEDLNARDKTGTTIFMYIVGFCEDVKLLRSMLTAGADGNAKNYENVTCLHFAATNRKNKEIVKILIDAGANPSALDDLRRLPLHFAISVENVHAVKTLLHYISKDDLVQRFGPKAENLIQCVVQVSDQLIFQYIWDTYQNFGVSFDVNEMNNVGQNLPMIALHSQNPEKLDTIFSVAFAQVNFDHRDDAGETFSHKFSYLQQMMKNISLFEKFPRLRDIVNSQMNIQNNKGETPIIIALYEHDDWITESCADAFVKLISFENAKAAFHRLCSSPKMMDRIFEKFPGILNELEPEEAFQALVKASENPNIYKNLLKKLEDKSVDMGDNNILHVVCRANSAELLDFTLKTLTAAEVASLSKKLDKDLKTPSEYLSEENKFLFEKCFC